MKKLLERHGLWADDSIKHYTDYKAMIAEVQPELVSIATESGIHAEIAIFCIKHGVHVIIEKPMAMSMADANEIIRLSEEGTSRSVPATRTDLILRYRKCVRLWRREDLEKLSHGSIHVRWNRNKNYYTQAPWRGTWAQDGGALMNQCIHGIDLLRWTFGGEIRGGLWSDPPAVP